MRWSKAVFSHHETNKHCFSMANWLTIGKKGETQIFVVRYCLSDFCIFVPGFVYYLRQRNVFSHWHIVTQPVYFSYLFCPLSPTKTFYSNGEITRNNQRITWYHFVERNQWFCLRKTHKHIITIDWRWKRTENEKKATKQTFTCTGSASSFLAFFSSYWTKNIIACDE